MGVGSGQAGKRRRNIGAGKQSQPERRKGKNRTKGGYGLEEEKEAGKGANMKGL